MLNKETLKETETILCAAIHVLDGSTYPYQPTNIENGFVVSGYRHCQCIVTIKLIYKIQSEYIGIENIQGFLTSHFRFVNRTEAFMIAKNANQIISNLIHEEKASLISEDLW